MKWVLGVMIEHSASLHVSVPKKRHIQVVGGLLDEAHALMEAGLTAGSAPVARAIGYRQALEWLQQVKQAGVADAEDVRRLAAAIQAASRQLAGSQIKFHRSDAHFKWVNASAGPAALVDDVIHHFNATEHCGMHPQHAVQSFCTAGAVYNVLRQ